MPPTIAKAFGAASIPLNGTTTLTFTLSNSNSGTTLTGIGFTDTLPAGLVVATPNGLTGSCGGGTITATAGLSSVSLSGATLAASASCSFAVNVTGTSAGAKNNTTGAVTSSEGGTGGTATASLTVVTPASIPTLSTWAFLLRALLLTLTALRALRAQWTFQPVFSKRPPCNLFRMGGTTTSRARGALSSIMRKERMGHIGNPG